LSSGSGSRAPFSSPILRSRFTREWSDTYLAWQKMVADEGHRSGVLCDEESVVVYRLLEVTLSVVAHPDLSPSPRVRALPSASSHSDAESTLPPGRPTNWQPARASPPTLPRLCHLPPRCAREAARCLVRVIPDEQIR
jgi:hypothetical protein